MSLTFLDCDLASPGSHNEAGWRCGVRIGANFIAIARRLMRDAHTEAEWRTVINRCYYGAFRTMRGYARTVGFVVDRNRSVHRHLIQFLHASDDATLNQCADLLFNLRTLREISDYDEPGGITKTDAQGAIEDAADIIEEKLVEIEAKKKIR